MVQDLIVHSIRVRAVYYRLATIRPPLAPFLAFNRLQLRELLVFADNTDPELRATFAFAAERSRKCGICVEERLNFCVVINVDRAEVSRSASKKNANVPSL